jgi:hypothetical protein
MQRAVGLKQALQPEKKRQRGKKLNLQGEASGCAQSFGVDEVLKAITLQEEKEKAKEQRRLTRQKQKLINGLQKRLRMNWTL